MELTIEEQAGIVRMLNAKFRRLREIPGAMSPKWGRSLYAFALLQSGIFHIFYPRLSRRKTKNIIWAVMKQYSKQNNKGWRI